MGIFALEVLSILLVISTAPMGVLPSNHFLSAFAYSETDDEAYYEGQTDLDSEESTEIEDDGDNPEDEYVVDTLLLADTASTGENSDVTINILANDRAYFGHERSIVMDSVSDPSYGNVIINSDNTVTYHPSQLRLPGDTVISDTFFYTASYNGGALQYTATVNIDIHQANDGPLVVDSEHVVANDQQFSFYLKAYDEDDDTLTFFIASFEGTGEYTLDPTTGMVIYMQYEGYTGEDLIVYGVRDQDSTSSLSRVSIITIEGSGINEEEEEEESSDNSEETDDVSYDYYDDHFSEDEEEEEQPSGDATDTDADDGSSSNVNGTSSDNDPTNQVPIADAGDDIEVISGELVELDGSGSFDPDGDEITYLWSQASGSTVELLDSEDGHPTFVAPELPSSDLTLTFELVVSDANSTSQASTVTVTVLPEPEVDASLVCTDTVPIIDISASDSEVDHLPSHAIDGDLETRWSEDEIGSWITLDLGEEMNICGIDIDWYQGDERAYNFTVAVSTDGTDYSEVYSDVSSGTIPSIVQYDFSSSEVATFVRITVNGNSVNNYAAITEIEIRGSS